MLDPTRPDEGHIAERLAGEPVIWFGSTRPDGRPHHVPVWFLWDDPTVVVFSGAGGQKLRNVAHQPAVTLTLDTAGGGTDVVILEGTAELLDAADVRADTTPGFVEKYAGLMEQGAAAWAEQFPEPIRVTVTRIRAWAKNVDPPYFRLIG